MAHWCAWSGSHLAACRRSAGVGRPRTLVAPRSRPDPYSWASSRSAASLARSAASRRCWSRSSSRVMQPSASSSELIVARQLRASSLQPSVSQRSSYSPCGVDVALGLARHVLADHDRHAVGDGADSSGRGCAGSDRGAARAEAAGDRSPAGCRRTISSSDTPNATRSWCTLSPRYRRMKGKPLAVTVHGGLARMRRATGVADRRGHRVVAIAGRPRQRPGRAPRRPAATRGPRAARASRRAGRPARRIRPSSRSSTRTSPRRRSSRRTSPR